MELSGKVIVVYEPKTGTSARTGNPWMMQEYVLEIPGLFPRHFAFSVFGKDRIKLFNIKNGEELTVQFDIDAREHDSKWYNDFRAYNILRAQVVSQPIQNNKQQTGENLPFLPPVNDNEEIVNPNDDSLLPF
jgi:hypothetical protein